MIFSGIQLPDEIRIALEEDRLVIFAGAGISIPPPSDLPSFNGLASKICGGASVEIGREDRVLGKMAREGTDVHTAASQILFNDLTKPTELHREILRLFKTAEKVRVVTTNFDDHFSKASADLFKKGRLDEYVAPALPLGDDFSGIVYLHGSARKAAKSLVMTDRDFGAAYLTRGWARDFLVPLFSRYTVLFVGYSHSDVTITYLARGLDQADIKPRRAMIPSSRKPQEYENWNHLEIDLVEYPIDISNELNQHQPLTDFFRQWADHSKESILTRAKRVRAIAQGLPPESTKVSEYLDYCLRHSRLAQDFCKAIRHPAWIGWMNDHGYFKFLFKAGSISSSVEQGHENAIARWLCSDVRRKYPELLLDLIQKNSQRLSPEFSQMLAHLLWVEHSKSIDPKFATWVSILLSQGRNAVSDNLWAYLLAECKIPEHLGVALRLFEILTTPEIQVKEGWDFSLIATTVEGDGASNSKKIEYSIKWPDQAQYHLSKAWSKVLVPHLAIIAYPLGQVVMKQLTHAHLIIGEVGRIDSRYNRLSWGRSSIAPHPQNRNSTEKCLSILIDILRDILLHWIKVDPQLARVQANIWWDSDLILLRRFSVYARSVDTQYSADECISWLISHDLIFRSGMKKEVFDVLKVAFPGASRRLRRRLLTRIGSGYRGAGAKRIDEKTLEYEKFNVLIWLRRADQTCALVREAIDIIKLSNPEFAEREHPNFDHWHGEVRFVAPGEGFDFKRILSEPPENYLRELMSAEDRSGGPDRWDYFRNLSDLYVGSKDWGRGLVVALSSKTEYNEQIWVEILGNWIKSINDDKDWNWIFDLIENLPHERAIYAGIANLISHGMWDENKKVSKKTVDRAMRLMNRAWILCSTKEEKPDDNYRDWLTSSINHLGGWIGEFWVHYCSHLCHRSNSKWQGIPDDLKGKIIEALNGVNRIRIYARIAITPWIGYFFEWDRKFAVDHLLPLLDWRRDPVIAQQTWSVLLNYNRGTSRELETQIIPYYRQFADQVMVTLKGATERSDQFDSNALQNLGHSLASLAMTVIDDPVESGFFRDFLPLLPDFVRGALARGIGNHLQKIDDKRRLWVWETWLRRYLDSRLIGVPVALSLDETKCMLEWCLHLGPAFEEAVDRISKMQHKEVFAYSIIEDLLKSPLLEKHPSHACRLAVSALKAEDFPYLYDGLLSLHQKFKKSIPGTHDLNAFEELLYLRGWEK